MKFYISYLRRAFVQTRYIAFVQTRYIYRVCTYFILHPSSFIKQQALLLVEFASLLLRGQVQSVVFRFHRALFGGSR